MHPMPNRSRSLVLTGVASGIICAGLALASPATGAVIVTTEPTNPEPDQPFQLVATPTDFQGTGSYAWSFDGDRECETPYSTDRAITITRPQGAYRVYLCAIDSARPASVFSCPGMAIVGPEPRATVTPSSIPLKQFQKSGATVTVTWNTPVRANYSLEYHPWNLDPLQDNAVPLQVTTSAGAEARTSTTIVIPPPPADTAGPASPPPGGVGAHLVLRPGLADDPQYKELGSAVHAPIIQLTSDNPTAGRSPDVTARRFDPKLVLRATRTGNLVTGTIQPGMALGRTATLHFFPFRGGMSTRRIMLRSNPTRFRYRIPPRTDGFLQVSVSTSFRKAGKLYQTVSGTPRSAVYLRW